MSEEKSEPTSEQQPDAPAPEAQQPAVAQKPRSPVERAIVWGIIIALLVVAVIELRAKSNWQKSLDQLLVALKESDEGEPLALTAAEEMIQGSPSREERKDIVTAEEGRHHQLIFTWKSLFKEYKIKIKYGLDDETGVIMIVVDDLVEEEFAIKPAPKRAADAGDEYEDRVDEKPEGESSEGESSEGESSEGESSEADSPEADSSEADSSEADSSEADSKKSESDSESKEDE